MDKQIQKVTVNPAKNICFCKVTKNQQRKGEKERSAGGGGGE